MQRPTWELGTRLMLAIQARDLAAAKSTLRDLLNVIRNESASASFDEIRLRVLQVLTNANRAAYHAGANPDVLLDLNAKLIDRLIKARNMRQLRSLASRIVASAVEAVPDKDYQATRRLGKAVEYIRAHCMKPITRDQVAQVVGCSPSHLSVMFTKAMGHTFKGVLLRYRMDRAKDLLRETDKTITEIAFEVGYREPGYFSTAFKRVTGITPGQHRRRVP